MVNLPYMTEPTPLQHSIVILLDSFTAHIWKIIGAPTPPPPILYYYIIRFFPSSYSENHRNSSFFPPNNPPFSLLYYCIIRFLHGLSSLCGRTPPPTPHYHIALSTPHYYFIILLDFFIVHIRRIIESPFPISIIILL